MDFLNLVTEARSCRRFVESERLGADAATWLVDCARVTPCARNAQVLRYAAAESPASCAALFPHTRWAGALKDWGGPQEGERPTLYIAILLPKESGKLVHMDTGIAAQTMQLAAHSRGWGCCMHASFDVAQCAPIFGVPQTMDMALLLAFGVVAEKRALASLPDDGNINYWRDAAHVHYVPKRALEDVLVSII